MRLDASMRRFVSLGEFNWKILVLKNHVLLPGLFFAAQIVANSTDNLKTPQLQLSNISILRVVLWSWFSRLAT